MQQIRGKMQPDFWHQKWQKNEIGFHLPEANVLLVAHLPSLALKRGSHIFLPLCGKTLDIAWLLEQGYRVAGAELSKLAVDDLFKSLGVVPKTDILGSITHYQAPNINIYVGDIFQLTASILGNVDAVYDRAALVALPVEMRANYTKHLLAITHYAPQLLICMEYDQTLQAGPPFSVDANEVKLHYQASYDLTLLASSALAGGLKGKCPATEQVWYLKPLN